MSHLEIVILAIVLSIDACVVSFTCALKYSCSHFKNSFSLAFCTGLFQAFMPVFGYYLTNFIKIYIEPYSKFIIFAIFTYLGIKFIIEARRTKENKSCTIYIQTLFIIGIATSIDAFSAGVSLSLFGNKIFKPAILIGLTTFINSGIGYFSGLKLKKLPSKLLEIIGGILLILLGIKALF